MNGKKDVTDFASMHHIRTSRFFLFVCLFVCFLFFVFVFLFCFVLFCLVLFCFVFFLQRTISKNEYMLGLAFFFVRFVLFCFIFVCFWGFFCSCFVFVCLFVFVFVVFCFCFCFVSFLFFSLFFGFCFFFFFSSSSSQVWPYLIVQKSWHWHALLSSQNSIICVRRPIHINPIPSQLFGTLTLCLRSSLLPSDFVSEIFLFLCPTFWNYLPEEIVQCGYLSSFKVAVHSHVL